MDTAFVLDGLEEVFLRYGQPEMFNTEQDSQALVEALTARGISMDGNGCWRNNVFVERIWHRVKYEEVYLKAFASGSHTK